ncbi:MAG: energy transducer TonB [Endomicrobiales bacterium]|nr:energy transducer TonB [Endomicrobiales bacterium]
MKKLLLQLQGKQIFQSSENNFLALSLLLHITVLTAISYSPVTTRLSIPTSEIDMINAELPREKTDEVKVEIKPDVIESDEPQYIEQKVMPLVPSKATIYLPIFEVNILPKVKDWIKPEYPEQARQSGIEVSVIVEIDLDERGFVVDTRIIKSAGFGFDEAALKAVKHSKFSPALKRGKPIPVRFKLPIRFELE